MKGNLFINRFKQLMEVSEKIVELYKEMINYLDSGKSSSNLSFIELDTKIKNLIKEEQSLFESSSNTVLMKYITKLEREKTITPSTIRLMERIKAYLGKGNMFSIEAKSLGLDKPELQDKKFIMPDVIAYVPQLEAFKRLCTRICCLTPFINVDKNAANLVSALNQNLVTKKLNMLIQSPFYETLFLAYYDKIPVINIDKMVSAIPKNSAEEMIFNTYMDKFFKCAFDAFYSFVCDDYTIKVKYNNKDIFNFFLSSAELEVLVPYIRKDLLHELEILFNRPVTIGRFEFEPISTREAIKKELKK